LVKANLEKVELENGKHAKPDHVKVELKKLRFVYSVGNSEKVIQK